MIRIRKSSDRGHVRRGWLESRHSFSFGEYHDSSQMGFGPLRVINEDRVQPGTGFGPHGHRDMEIVTYVVSGALEHQDSMGNGSVIRRGDIQSMGAGTGVLHSEMNPSRTEPVHLLQIWIEPAQAGLPPAYAEKHFGEAERSGRLCAIASGDGHEGSLRIRQDASIQAASLSPGDGVEHVLAPGRRAWLQLIDGALQVGGVALGPGDAAALCEEASVCLRAERPSELLLFDLP